MVVTNVLTVELFIDPLRPYISNVTGCGVQNDLRNLSQCHSGDVLTMYGGHLDQLSLLGGSYLTDRDMNDDSTSLFLFTCELLPANSSADADGNMRVRQCLLPIFDSSIDGDTIEEGVRYEFSIVEYPFNLYEAFSVEFSSVLPDSPPDFSDDAGLSSGTVAGIVVAVVVAAVAVVAMLVVLMRRWKGTRGGGRAADHSFDTDSNRWKALHGQHASGRQVEMLTKA